MPPTKKSVFRGPEAQHFQLVHRSLRDPLINDPEASQRVFKPITRGNDYKSGYTLADLEATVDKSSIRANEGEAAGYGITYDDSAYDYMAHLKPIGGAPGESMLIEGPRGSTGTKLQKNYKGKGKASEGGDLFGILPDSVLPSKTEMTPQQVYAAQAAIPVELQGLQPDMDPHLRQVLEALDDDAFVDDDEVEEGDDWFGELLGDGERRENESVEFEFAEWGVDEDAPKEEEQLDPDSWEARYAAFKKDGKKVVKSEVGDGRSEMQDTVGSLMSNMGDLMVAGGKKRRGKRGPSDATGMSMSSSSMFRNEGLRTLDERFDKIERDYEMDDDEEYYSDDDNVSIAPSMMSTVSRSSLLSHMPSSPPKVTREDFDAILDDFLDNFEVVGNRMRQSLGTNALSGPQKLQVLRDAIDGEGSDGVGHDENRRRILELERLENLSQQLGKREKREKMERMPVVGDKENKWDCETILSRSFRIWSMRGARTNASIATYTNTENHPAVIRSRSAAATKARAERQLALEKEQEEAGSDSDSGSETETEDRYKTTSRPKGETKDDRKARKGAVKAERSARRAEKKAHKQTFGDERKKQLNQHKKLVANGKAADLNVAKGSGVISLS
ncbi:protein LTV1, partial [Tremellales sp. Uapishka_1]